MIRNLYFFSRCISLLFVCLAGCTFSGSNPVTLTVEKPPTSFVTRTTTPSSTATNDEITLTPTLLQPTATETINPSETPTPQLPTPLPTLSEAEAQAFILEMFATNNNCQFPCWWGIVPGETRAQEALDFLRTFSREVEIFVNKERKVQYYATFDVPVSINQNGEFTFSLTINEGIVESYFSEGNWSSEIDYSLSGLLNTFGPPSEVWLHGQPVTIDEQPRYTYVLFYPEQGIMTAKTGKGKLENESLRICPQDSNSSPSLLWLWSPERTLTFLDVADGVLVSTSPLSNVMYFRIEEVTNMDVDTFFETYLDPVTKECIHSPTAIWP